MPTLVTLMPLWVLSDFTTSRSKEILKVID
jgi:hypothetical protein